MSETDLFAMEFPEPENREQSSGETDTMSVLEIPPDLLTAVLDNMAVSNRKSGSKSSDSRCKGGIDTLHLALVVEWSERTEQYWEMLSRCQQAAKNADDNGSYFRIGTELFRVLASGAGGKNKVFRHFIFEGLGIYFEFSRFSAKQENFWNVTVRVGSIACNAIPLEDLHKRVHLLVKCFGGRILRESVSRCDFYVDDTAVSHAEVCKAMGETRCITRAQKWGFLGENKNSQTLQIGRGIVMLRVYDKLAELRERPDLRKEEQIAGKFGGSLPDTVTRFEFQLRRKFFRQSEIPINSVDDLRNNINTICHYLVTQWVRFADSPVDKKNSNRAKPAEWWSRITETFSTLGDDLKKNLVRVTRKVKNAPGLMRQALGCLLQACHENVVSIDGFLREVYEQLRKLIADIGTTEFLSRLARCHANGRQPEKDVSLSEAPELVTAEQYLGRLQLLFRKGREADREKVRSGWLFGDDDPIFAAFPNGAARVVSPGTF